MEARTFPKLQEIIRPGALHDYAGTDGTAGGYCESEKSKMSAHDLT